MSPAIRLIDLLVDWFPTRVPNGWDFNINLRDGDEREIYGVESHPVMITHP